MLTLEYFIVDVVPSALIVLLNLPPCLPLIKLWGEMEGVAPKFLMTRSWWFDIQALVVCVVFH